MAEGNATRRKLLDAHNVLGAKLPQASGVVTVLRRLAEQEGEDWLNALWSVEVQLTEIRAAYGIIEAHDSSSAGADSTQESPANVEDAGVAIGKALGIAMALSEKPGGDKHDSNAADAIVDLLVAAKKALAGEEAANA